MATTEKSSKSMQLWPGGKSIETRGDGPDMEVRFGRGDAWRPPTEEERRAVRIEELAEAYQRQNIYCLDNLAGDLIQAALSGELPKVMAEEFEWDKVQNLRPDPSDWDLAKCKEWLDDHGHDLPDPNPWGMARAELVEALGRADEQEADEFEAGVKYEEADDALRALVIEEIDDESIDGLDDWREAVRDNAEDEEVYQWFRIDSWLCEQLSVVGEVVLDNAYGYWWGRGCCGQDLIMDGVLQKVAALYVNKFGV